MRPSRFRRRRFNAFSPMAMRFVAMWSAIRHQGPVCRAPQEGSTRAGAALTSRAWAACLFGEAVDALRADWMRSAVRGRSRGADPRAAAALGQERHIGAGNH